ncbi:SPW repeat protein [Methylorubrum extorquens]
MTSDDQDRLISYDISIAALAVYLFFAPWVWGYSELRMAAWNSWLSGAAIAGLSVWMYLRPQILLGVAHSLGGLWVLTAPWALHVSADAKVLWTHVAVGTGIIAFTVAEASHLLGDDGRSGGSFAF